MRSTCLVAASLNTWASSSPKQSHQLVCEILPLHLPIRIQALWRAGRMVESSSVSGWRPVHGCSTTSADTVCVLRTSQTFTEFCTGNALKQYTCARVWVKLDSVREMYQMGIGAHPDQSMSRFIRSDYAVQWDVQSKEWQSCLHSWNMNLLSVP